MMSDVAIRLDNISKHYRLYDDAKDRLKEALNPFRKTYHTKHQALSNIDLTIHKGDVIGIVGRNGCGKSTLLKIITKVLQPNEGTVTVNGKITALLELGAGFNPEFTGIDNIKFYANILGLSHREIDERLDAIIGFAELGEYLYQPVKTYSSGMKARLGFSVAAHVEPDILILDEVLAVGDELFAKKCFKVVRSFIEQNKTIVLVSHSAGAIVDFCNRAVLINDSKVCADGDPKKVIKEYRRLLFNSTELASTNQDEDVETNLGLYDNSLDIEAIVDHDDKSFRIDSHLMTVDDKKVNVVRFDEIVSIAIKIKHKAGFSSRDYHTGMTIVTHSGQRLAAIKFSSVTVDKDYVCMKAEFQCNLNQGLYSIIFSIMDKTTQKYCYFVNDLFLFRVIRESHDNFHRWALLEMK